MSRKKLALRFRASNLASVCVEAKSDVALVALRRRSNQILSRNGRRIKRDRFRFHRWLRSGGFLFYVQFRIARPR